jgi:hypothetical protein
MDAGKTFFHVSQTFVFWLGELQRLHIGLRGAARPSRPRRYKSLLNRFIKGRIVGFSWRGVFPSFENFFRQKLPASFCTLPPRRKNRRIRLDERSLP